MSNYIRMRTILLIVVLLSFATIKAQTVASLPIAGYTQGRFANNIYLGDSLSTKKWSFSRYSGISTSFTFFKGGNATIVSAPMGLQVNRMLNNNLYAFGNIVFAPAYTNFNHSFITTGFNKNNPGNMFSGQGSLGVYSAASMGLMYINNDKTFSISGSISIEKSSYPLLPFYPTNNSKPIPFHSANR
jgi:hypothetical protein